MTDSPAPAARPTTAAKRTEEARKEAGAPQDTASERLAAKERTADESEEDRETPPARFARRRSIARLRPRLEADPRIERAEPIEGLDKRFDENPYAPLGLRVGTFTRVAQHRERPHLDVECQFQRRRRSRAAIGIDAAAQRRFRLGERQGDDRCLHQFPQDGFGRGDRRDARRRQGRDFEHELAGDWKALGAIRYEIGPESASSPDAIVGTLDQPIKQTFEGSVGAEKDVGKLQLRLTGNVEREVFGDADLSSGGTVSQEDRNSTLVAGVLRTGYEISPALTPFVEVEYGHRSYDLDVDSNGFDRAATRSGARAGLELDLGEKFSGEFSAGWINEDLADPRLASVSGPSVSADLNWSPVRGTIVGLDAQTTVEGATGVDESGSILYASELTVERELRANLTAELGFAAGLRDYTGEDGRDVILGAEARTTYWFNRYLGLTGRLRHERLDSTLPGRDYKTNSVFVGLKMQR